MDKHRLLRDLKIPAALKSQGVIRDYDYNIDGRDDWIAIFGAFPVPAGRFNYPDVNIKLPIPANLYDPSSKDRFYFYDVIFIDSKLRVKGKHGGWEPVPRQILRMYPDEERKGWSLLCVIPHDAWADTDLRSVIALAQAFLLGGE